MRDLLGRFDSFRGIVLFGSALSVVLAFVLTPTAEVVSIFGLEVPTLCVWRLTLGLECWGCGLTRSFTFFAHGEVAEAFAMNKLGPPLFLAVAAQVPWQLYRIVVGNPDDGGARSLD